VSVCPVNALDLRETRLIVAETCIECNLCLSACPMGALIPAGECLPAEPPIRESYDIVVIGAGPGGALAAREAASLGCSVLLLEKRQEIGSPVRCAEGIASESLARFIAPDAVWISAEIRRVSIALATREQEKTWASQVPSEQHVGYVLERRVFDRVLAEQAARAGARVEVKTAALGLLLDGDAVKGVVAEGPCGRREIAARVVIGADGIESRVGAWCGLDTTLPLGDHMACAQFLLSGIDVDPQCTYYYLDAEVAPGGYAWVFPKGEGRANVGLGVEASLSTHSPLDLLTRFIEQRSWLAQGSPVTLIAGGVPVGLPPARIVTHGCMLVGDAARQVDPLTGGGIANAMAAGVLAGRVAAEAVAAGDVSQHALQRYEQAWNAGPGRQMLRNYRLRQRFPSGERMSERFAGVFAMAVGGAK